MPATFIEKPVVLRFPDRLNPSRTVNGVPANIVVTLFSCQPFRITAREPESERPNGMSQVQLKVRLCFTLNADGPRSRSRSYQSSTYCTLLSKSCELMPLASSTDLESVYETCARSPREYRCAAASCSEW